MPEAVPAFRRSWPQRLVIVLTLGVIAACVAAAYGVAELDQAHAEIFRVDVDAAIPPGFDEQLEPGDPVNFLLVGIDSGAGLDPDDPRNADRQDETVLADTILLLRLDPVLGQAAVLSIPRDLRIEFNGAGRKVNSIRAIEGPDALIGAISETLEVPIHKYVEVDFAGFAHIIEAMGGVEVQFDNPARSQRAFFEVPAGCWRLDGDESLGFVRARSDFQEFIDGRWQITGGDDFARIERQQTFLVLAAQQATSSIGTNPLAVRRLLLGIQEARAVTLDDRTSIQELIDLSQAFANFNATNLRRFSLSHPYVYDAPDGSFDLLLDVEEVQPVLDVFRGFEGLVTPDDVSVVLVDAPQAEIEALAARVGVTVGEDREQLSETVVEVGADRLDEAEVLTRILAETPRVEVVDDPGRLVLVIGDDYSGIVLFQREQDEVAAEFAAATGAGSADGTESTPSTTTTESAEAIPDEARTTTTVPAVLPWQPASNATCEELEPAE